jgi:hypothetical protein
VPDYPYSFVSGTQGASVGAPDIDGFGLYWGGGAGFGAGGAPLVLAVNYPSDDGLPIAQMSGTFKVLSGTSTFSGDGGDFVVYDSTLGQSQNIASVSLTGATVHLVLADLSSHALAYDTDYTYTVTFTGMTYTGTIAGVAVSGSTAFIPRVATVSASGGTSGPPPYAYGLIHETWDVKTGSVSPLTITSPTSDLYSPGDPAITPLVVTGTAVPNAEVWVTLSDPTNVTRTVADGTGNWTVSYPYELSGGACAITAQSLGRQAVVTLTLPLIPSPSGAFLA